MDPKEKNKKEETSSRREFSDPARDLSEKVLTLISEKTSKLTGSEFIAALTEELALGLNVCYAIAGELTGGSDEKMQTIVVASEGKKLENFTFGLTGTPFENIGGKIVSYYPEKTQDIFPNTPHLRQWGIESCISVPLNDSRGEAIGVLSLLHTKPLPADVDAPFILSTLSVRAGIELERKKDEDARLKVQEELERRVEERTKELKKANEKLRNEINERLRVEEALRVSEDLYRTLSESAQDFIFIIDRDFQIQYINNYSAVSLGISKDRIIGNSLGAIMPPSELEHCRENINKVFATGEPAFFEKNIVLSDRELWLGTRLNPLLGPDGSVKAVMGISRDITERMRWAVEIRKERDLAQKYLDIAGVMIVIINSSAKVTLINRKGCEILGYSEKEIIGKNWFEHFIPEDIRSSVQETFRQLINGKSEGLDKFVNVVLTARGERTIEWNNKFLRDESGVITATLSSGEDITERKRREEEREALIKELTGALANIKTLKGLLPICATCKKIRDDKGYWKKLEIYIQEHSEADFSHGICPDCVKKMIL
ncbi:MAG: PAS domain S-box protein [Deltaproteobacteria bacterium]|nr:PAS domain S-box protein [Deltaproteobacteria bacterium]